MIGKALFASETDDWATPQDFFDELNEEFHFDLDVCASDTNHKCAEYFTEEQDGLSQPWHGFVWCNPPYGREVIKWAKAVSEYPGGGVMLLPARTDTKWFHEYVYHKADELRFVRGRLHFGHHSDRAPFPSLVAVFYKKDNEGKENGN